MNDRMKEVLPNACFIAFTGTPIAKKEKSTFAKFGDLVQPTYSIRDAVADKAVVPLLYEGREVVTDVDEGQIDRWFEVHTRGLQLRAARLRGRELRGVVHAACPASTDLMIVTARDPDDQAHCGRLIKVFYALNARSVFRERLLTQAAPFERKGLKRPRLVVRELSKRWGSYTPNGRIVLNIDLIRAAPDLIDYVISHEFAHGLHPDHGAEWRNLLTLVMPDRQARKGRLEAALR